MDGANYSEGKAPCSHDSAVPNDRRLEKREHLHVFRLARQNGVESSISYQAQEEGMVLAVHSLWLLMPHTIIMLSRREEKPAMLYFYQDLLQSTVISGTSRVHSFTSKGSPCY